MNTELCPGCFLDTDTESSGHNLCALRCRLDCTLWGILFHGLLDSLLLLDALVLPGWVKALYIYFASLLMPVARPLGTCLILSL